MDNRLVLTVIFMMLSWMFVGICTGNTTATTGVKTTAAAATGATTPAPATPAANTGNHTAAAATPAANTGNHTAAAATPAANTGNHTTAAAATPAANTGNHTTAAAAATPAANTGNNTTAAAAAGNTTLAAATPAATTGVQTTTAPTTTSASPLMPNTTVEALVTPVSRTDCGSTQLCAAEPSDCDPSQAGSCFFLSAEQTSGRNFEFALSGESTGYLSASLSLDATAGGNDTTYICANNNSNIQFFSALFNNGRLTLTTLNVNSVKGSVDGNKIQCTFAATVPEQLNRAQGFSLSVSTGTFDAATGDLGSPTARIQTPVVNLANPNATITNEVTTNTTTTITTTSPSTAAPTTSHAVTLQQSLTQALLVTVGVLGLAML